MNGTRPFIALAGLGYWGKNILRNLHELGVLHTAFDSSAGAAEAHKAKYPGVKFADSFDELLSNPEITAVAIATPAATHYALARKAMLAGKDVFVEKPLALNVKEGEELAAIAAKEKRALMVGHILQYHRAVIKLKEMISAGELGKLQYVYSNRLNIGKLRTEENILWSFAPHDISVMLALVGSGVRTVSAFGEDYLSKGIYDTTLTSIEFANGVKGHIFVSWLHPFKEQKLVVVGSKAMAVFDDVTEEKLFLYPHRIEWVDGKVPVAHKAEFKAVALDKGDEPLKAELRHFAECCVTRKRPRTDAAEGIEVLKVLESAEASLAAGASRTSAVAAMPEKTGYFAHESAYVDDGARIGEGTKIWHFTHIMKNTAVGKNCNIGQNVVAGPDVTIGDRCKIQNNVSIYKGVTLEDEVFCGPSCVFTNVYNPRAFIERKHEYLPTLVKRGSTIGANATIVCGNTVGRYSVIGAGAVVKKDVPDYAIVVGVPAKQIGWACKCGVTLEFKGKTATCVCGNRYAMKGKSLTAVKEA